jgi:hypothetical protein
MAAGVAVIPLVTDPKRWINRRVETIEVLSHEQTRRQVSVDFTLSSGQRKALTTGEGVVVPISALAKQRRRDFDLRDEAGRAVPVLGKEQDSQLALFVVLDAVFMAFDEPPSEEVFESLVPDIRSVVVGSTSDATETFAQLRDRAQNRIDPWQVILENRTCYGLLNVLKDNYLLFAVLSPSRVSRRILKYSYSERMPLAPEQIGIPGRLRLARRRLRYPDRQYLAVECADASRARSFHAELVIPDELRIEQAVIRDAAADTDLSETDLDEDRASLHAGDVPPDAEVELFAVVVPERSGGVWQYLFAGLAVVGLLWLGVASGLRVSEPSAAVEILTAGAGLASGLTAIRGEHRFVHRAFAATRRALLIVAVTALGASALLAFHVPSARPVTEWWIAAMAASLASARLAWSVVRSPR